MPTVQTANGGKPSGSTSDEDALDEALEETFPASDPPARSDPDVGVGKPDKRERDDERGKG